MSIELSNFNNSYTNLRGFFKVAGASLSHKIPLIMPNTANNLPLGLSKKQLEAIELNYHWWIVYNGRHYDAECPEGVQSFLELPIYKRVFKLLEKYLKGNKLIVDGKISTISTDVIEKFKAWEIEHEEKYRERGYSINGYWEEMCPEILGYEQII